MVLSCCIQYLLPNGLQCIQTQLYMYCNDSNNYLCELSESFQSQTIMIGYIMSLIIVLTLYGIHFFCTTITSTSNYDDTTVTIFFSTVIDAITIVVYIAVLV